MNQETYKDILEKSRIYLENTIDERLEKYGVLIDKKELVLTKKVWIDIVKKEAKENNIQVKAKQIENDIEKEFKKALENVEKRLEIRAKKAWRRERRRNDEI